MISENLPRRTGLSADAGPGTSFEWTPGGRGWEAETREPGGRSWEAGEIRMFNHCAIGLRSGLLPQVVVLQDQKLVQKRDSCGRSFREGFDFGCQGTVF